jgi:uncharacterized membrane protein
VRIQWATTRPWDLLAVAALAVGGALVALADAPPWLRVPLGLASVLVAPGYAFVAALYPERHHGAPDEGEPKGKDAQPEAPRRGLEPLERAALSLGLSIAIVPLLGLALNYTPWGIREGPIVATLGAFTAATLGVAWWRRRALPEDERLLLRVHVESPAWSERGRLDQLLTVALVGAVLFAAGSLVYVLATPRQAEAFTEFYVLGPTGTASCYPAAYAEGQYRVTAADAQAGCPLHPTHLTLGIVNHEGRDVEYTLRTVWTKETRLPDNTTQVEAVVVVSATPVLLPSVPVDLSLNATFRPQHEADVAIPAPPFNGTVRLSFQLYLGAPPPAEATAAFLESPYRRLHLWIDVEAPASAPGA